MVLPLVSATVDARVAAIRAIADDDEVAHSEEDKLHKAVLKAIADGVWREPPALLAKAALKTTEIDFARHCG